MKIGREQELLSAYLDGALTGADRRRFETELEGNKELARQLAELQLIKGTLQTMPRLKSPRSFALTPAMAGIAPRRTSSLYPALRAITAVAAIAFLALFAADIFLLGGQDLASPETSSQFSESPAESDVEALPAAGMDIESSPAPFEEAPIAADEVAVEEELAAAPLEEPVSEPAEQVVDMTATSIAALPAEEEAVAKPAADVSIQTIPPNAGGGLPTEGESATSTIESAQAEEDSLDSATVEVEALPPRDPAAEPAFATELALDGDEAPDEERSLAMTAKEGQPVRSEEAAAEESLEAEDEPVAEPDGQAQPARLSPLRTWELLAALLFVLALAGTLLSRQRR